MAYWNSTECCSLFQLSATNSDVVKMIKKEISFIKNEESDIATIFCITTPEEKILEKRLKSCGFKQVFSFPRCGWKKNDKEVLKFWLLKTK